MADLNPIEQLVVNAMRELGASSIDKTKTADDITRKCNRAKGQINNALTCLVQKGVAGRLVKEKSSGYYLTGK